MKKLTEITKCYGCTACMNICPKKCISMQTNEKGFKYPVIDKEKCIDCGLCHKICPANNTVVKDNACKIVYAAKHKDISVIKQSTSGGVFTALSDYVLNEKGVIYGTKLSEEMKVTYTRVTTKKERDNLRGSKYVQSDLKDTFSELKKDLENQKTVLFVGNPCYVAGLKSYLKKDYPNLILCDIVCHGVPSPLIFEEHIKLINSKDKIKKYIFRDKSVGWRGTNVTIEYGNKKESNTEFSSIFSNLYFDGYISRENCATCKFTSVNRVSDITIGDFWGIEKNSELNKINDEKGINLVMINTNKGSEIFEKISSDIVFLQSEVENCLQPQLQYPAKQNTKKDAFWNDYYNKGFIYVSKKYTSYGLKNKIFKLIKKMIPRKIKNILKRGN